MMTCTSEMSGKASSGIRSIDQIPAKINPATPIKTINRFALHQSIILSIIRFPPSHRHWAGNGDV